LTPINPLVTAGCDGVSLVHFPVRFIPSWV